jgi:hypothetical protein
MKHTEKILTLSAMLFLSACGAAPTFNGTSTLGNTGVVASSISNSKSTNSVNTITVSSTNNVTASSAKSTTTSRANSSSAVTSSVSVVIASSSSKSSSAPKTTSHNVGKNCLSCHKIGVCRVYCSRLNLSIEWRGTNKRNHSIICARN